MLLIFSDIGIVMKRLVDWHLKKWKDKESRKPLLLRGARQIGKTYAVRQLGKSFKNFVEINFELSEDVLTFFERDLDPKRIIMQLGLYAKQEIIPGETLLFFDEIQQCPKALISLRYFYELLPDLHVIAAGSLLDFAIEEVGIPVGRVSSLYMYPLSFMEFLVAIGEKLLVKAILNHDETKEMPLVIHNRLLDFLGHYLAIGGMPEPVKKWVENNNLKESFEAHHDIIDNYRMDFRKYAKKHQIKYLEQLYSQIPYLVGQLFQYKNIHGEYRKRELAPCMDLLEMANVIHRSYHTAAQGLPLGAGVNLEWFKVTFLDIALCQAILGFDLSTWFLSPGKEFINRGMIAESFVGQEMLCYAQPFKKASLYFWHRLTRSSTAEVDYICDYMRHVVPIEVKSGSGGKLKSMHMFLKDNPHVPFGFHFSMLNYSIKGQIVSKPLYAVVSIAHSDQKEALCFLYD